MAFQHLDFVSGGGIKGRKTILKTLKESGLPTVVFGPGIYGEAAAQVLDKENIPILCFLDMDKYWHEGKTVTIGNQTIKCLTKKQLLEIKKPYTMITNHTEYAELSSVQTELPQCTYVAHLEAKPIRIMTKEFLQKNAVSYRRLYNELRDEESRNVMESFLYARYTGDVEPLCSLNRWSMSYDYELLHLTKEDVVVDGGAYTGDTIEEITRYLGDLPKKVFAFEPDSGNAANLQANFSRARDQVIVVNAGLYDHDGVIHFSASGTDRSKVEENGSGSIAIQALDIHPEYAGTTVIKMDIEGSELKALQGAKTLLRTQKPRLAVCVYHKNEDLSEIYEYLSEFGYDFYLRQHESSPCQTVLYAI